MIGAHERLWVQLLHFLLTFNPNIHIHWVPF